jgi:dihydrofolate reductase
MSVPGVCCPGGGQDRPAEWTNSTVLSGDAVDEITKLRKEQDGDIVVHGSAQLVQSLIENVAIQVYTRT